MDLAKFIKATGNMYIPNNANLYRPENVLQASIDNVNTYKYAFNQNIPCGSRVMSIFTNIPRPAEMMLDEASSSFCIPVAGQC